MVSVLGTGVFNSDGTLAFFGPMWALSNRLTVRRRHVEVSNFYSKLLFNTVSQCSCNRFHRSMTRPFFSRDRISHFDNFDRHADETIKLMKERLRAGYSIDFQVNDLCNFPWHTLKSLNISIGCDLEIHNGLCFRVSFWSRC